MRQFELDQNWNEVTLVRVDQELIPEMDWDKWNTTNLTGLLKSHNRLGWQIEIKWAGPD